MLKDDELIGRKEKRLPIRVVGSKVSPTIRRFSSTDLRCLFT